MDSYYIGGGVYWHNSNLGPHVASDTLYCPECRDKKDRQEWQEYQQKERKEEDPIERYSNKILGIIPDYEITYEEEQRDIEARRERISKVADEILEQASEEIKPRPDNMTKTQWNKERRERKRLAKEEWKERKKNQDLRYHGSPNSLIEERIRKIPCDCEAEEMRAGKFCKTCKLLVKVNDYMISLFKDAAEGRSTVI